MKKIGILLILISAVSAFGQGGDKAAIPDKPKPIEAKQPLGKVEIKEETPMELAQNAVKALGGDKFKNMKTLVVNGVADISAGGPSSTMQGAFATVFSGEKYRIEIKHPFQPFSQTFDGENTNSSLGSRFSLPPLNRIGMALLQRMHENGYVVAELAIDPKKKPKGFRITSPEGYFTDFQVDEKNGQVKSYSAQYIVNDQTVTTSVDISKFRDVDGVLVPEKYAQRFELGQITVYADFKAKEILVNSKVDDSVFAMPK